MFEQAITRKKENIMNKEELVKEINGERGTKIDIITVIIIPKEPIINSIFSPKFISICFINKPTTNTVLVIKNIKIKTHKKTK